MKERNTSDDLKVKQEGERKIEGLNVYKRDFRRLE